MEALLRKSNIPLFSLESKRPLQYFDILGFTLPYETLYTNVLNILDLSKIPLHSSKRKKDHPLIIAGGHATYNPEPMHAFIDAFVIGEGENVIHQIIEVQQSWKQMGTPRQELLTMLADIPGLYIPSLYQITYHPDGTLRQFTGISPNVKKEINKQIVPILPKPPTQFIVPNISVVHDRIAIEIMRGCTRGCRFCHAGIVTRPIRERTVIEIAEAVNEGLKNTGCEEIALLSLSSCDYTHISELVSLISNQYSGRDLTISLPSLRIDEYILSIFLIKFSILILVVSR